MLNFFFLPQIQKNWSLNKLWEPGGYLTACENEKKSVVNDKLINEETNE